MKKLVIASAVAAAMASSAVVADVTSFGNIRLGIASEAETDMEGGKLAVGFKGEDDLGNGMIGFFNVEFEHDAADRESVNQGFKNDKSYVGLKGDFGAVTLGEQGDAAGFACGGTDIFTYNGGAACGMGAANTSISNAITYANSFGDATIVVGATIDGSADGTDPANGDHTLFAFNYVAGAFQIGAQMTMPDSEIAATPAPIEDLANQLVIGGTWTTGETIIGLTIADGNGFGGNVVDLEGGDNLDIDETDSAVAVGVQFPLAGGTFLAAIDTSDFFDDQTNVQFHKPLSKSVYTGVQITMYDEADDDFLAAYLGYKW